MSVVIRILIAIAACALLIGLPSGSGRAVADENTEASDVGEQCISCHRENTPVIVAQWESSMHGAEGVTCIECHAAGADDPDAFEHEGALIATIVTPTDCANCHEPETSEFAASHHAIAAQFVGSLDNVLGMLAEGPLAAANGCWQCHGSTVSMLTDAGGAVQRAPSGAPLFDPQTWPNTGIGRVNLDGSKGSCTACHSRHAFSSAMARQPEVCGKCHMGPDHPQMEIYEESKHGIAYRTRIDEMNLGADEWVLGEDYSAAPTCATCHMSATRSLPVTHDIGERISWTLRPVISKKLENADARRAKMQSVCGECHSPAFVGNFYKQFDSTVEMWNEKFAKPAQSIMDRLKETKAISTTPFDDEIEWTFYRLWHHEGRRARMGVSMQGPDYTQWHGFFEVAERFYLEFIPQAKELAHGDAKTIALIEEILARPEHMWKKGLTPEKIQEIQSFYEGRYGQ